MVSIRLGRPWQTALGVMMQSSQCGKPTSVFSIDTSHESGGNSVGGLFYVCYRVPVGLWMQRNADLGSSYAITDSPRAASNLLSWIVYNAFFPMEYAAALIYWIRGFGDILARAVFPTEV